MTFAAARSALRSMSFVPVLLAAACGSADDHKADNESNQTTNGRFASHGMVITGDPGTAFISHVPSFGPPHDVQLVAAGALSALSGASLPPSFSDQLFTFLPDPLSLDALRGGTLRILEGKLFLGSNEHDGRPVPGRFHFEVSHVVHQHILEFNAMQPALTYLLFGSRAHTFAVHKIAGSPSFDEVMHVDLGGDGPTDAELSAGLEAQVADATDQEASRSSVVDGPRSMHAGARTFTMKRLAALSCLEGPQFFDLCK
jgi:hypothetical protein